MRYIDFWFLHIINDLCIPRLYRCTTLGRSLGMACPRLVVQRLS